MAQHHGLYSRSDLYDIALGRDVTREVDFIVEVHRSIRGRAPDSALELACGPGYHALELGARGVRTWGLDLRPEMVDLGQQRSETRGLDNVTFVAEDMREFRLAEPVDVAFALFDSIDCLLTNDDIVRHFRSVAMNLTPGGLYVVDCTHPRDCSFQQYGTFKYVGERNGTRVEVLWAVNDPMVDPVTGVVETEIEIRVTENGETQVLRDKASERCVTANELSLIANLSGALRPVAWFGDFDLGVPLDASETSTRMIGVFQK